MILREELLRNGNVKGEGEREAERVFAFWDGGAEG